MTDPPTTTATPAASDTATPTVSGVRHLYRERETDTDNDEHPVDADRDVHADGHEHVHGEWDRNFIADSDRKRDVGCDGDNDADWDRYCDEIAIHVRE